MKYLIRYELINSKQIMKILILNYVVITFFNIGIFSVNELSNRFLSISNSVVIYIFIIWRGSKLIKDLNPEHNVIEHMISIDKDKFIIAKILSSIILFAPLFVIMLLIALVFGFKLF